MQQTPHAASMALGQTCKVATLANMTNFLGLSLHLCAMLWLWYGHELQTAECFIHVP